MAGKPLIAYSIAVAKKTKSINRIIVSTDSEEYAFLAKEYKAEVPFLRGKEDSDDITPVHIATINALIKFEFYLSKSFDVVVQLMPNCPLRSGADIINAYNHFCANKSKFQISVFKFGWMNPWWALEIDEKTYSSISENDELEIDTDNNQIKNITKNQTYSMKPFPDLIGKIISAGGLFKYKS